MREPAKSTRFINKLTQWHSPVTTLILCYKQVLCQSLFRKALPRSPVANADAHTITVNALPMGLHALSVARRTTGLTGSSERRHSSSVCSLYPGRPQKQRQQRFSSKQFNKGRGREGNKQRSTPNKPDTEQRRGGKVTRLLSSWILNSSQDQHTLPK